MLNGQTETMILDAKGGIVRILKDSTTNSYSIGIRTLHDFDWKFISQELYELLVKELSKQNGNK